jgi:hypothetical protein
MRKAILILMLAITTQSYAGVNKNYDEFLTQNINEMDYRLKNIQRLDADIERLGGDMEIELTCQKREAVRSYIQFLDDTYNSPELLELSKTNSKFIQARAAVLEMKNGWQKSIDQFDEEFRQHMNVNPSFKFFTLDFTCEKTGY